MIQGQFAVGLLRNLHVEAQTLEVDQLQDGGAGGDPLAGFREAQAHRTVERRDQRVSATGLTDLGGLGLQTGEGGARLADGGSTGFDFAGGEVAARTEALALTEQPLGLGKGDAGFVDRGIEATFGKARKGVVEGGHDIAGFDLVTGVDRHFGEQSGDAGRQLRDAGCADDACQLQAQTVVRGFERGHFDRRRLVISEGERYDADKQHRAQQSEGLHHGVWSSQRSRDHYARASGLLPTFPQLVRYRMILTATLCIKVLCRLTLAVDKNAPTAIDEESPMIKPEDAEFHFNKDSHWQWVETIALPFHVPGTTVSGIVYFMARPMLGCACATSRCTTASPICGKSSCTSITSNICRVRSRCCRSRYPMA